MVLCVSIICVAESQRTDAPKVPFTVRDSIEMMRILAFSPVPAVNPPSGTALFSPDRSQFVLHTRRGDLVRNVNIESLLLFTSGEVLRYLASEEDGGQASSATTGAA